MGLIKDTVGKLFGYPVTNTRSVQQISNPVTRTMAGKKITVKLVEFLQNISDFSNMQDEEMQEQMFIWEPEVGGALDRLSTLVAECYQGPILMDTDKATSEIEETMLKEAKRISDRIQMANQFEMYGELLPLFGDVYVDVRDPLTYRIIPNKYVTIVESKDQINQMIPNVLMTNGNYLVFNETFQTNMFILEPSQWIHLKYKDTPIFAVDKKGRQTYGIYSVSPVQRAIIATWQKRQTSIIDILYRWRIIPREIHSVDSTIFALDQFSGSQMDRLDASKTKADQYISEYNKSIENQTPDQGYTVLDTIDIKMLETKANSYMRTNELIDQLDAKVWTALNMPKSVVTGEGAGSYASELIISNYVSQKALQIAKKIRPLLLTNLRARLLMINPEFPVEKIDLKLELEMAATRLETFREMAIMASLGCFTQTEIRSMIPGYAPLTEEQKSEVVTGGRTVQAALDQFDSLQAKYPDTPQSDSQHKQDSGQQAVTKTQKSAVTPQ
jgi:hypothetical protein